MPRAGLGLGPGSAQSGQRTPRTPFTYYTPRLAVCSRCRGPLGMRLHLTKLPAAATDPSSAAAGRPSSVTRRVHLRRCRWGRGHGVVAGAVVVCVCVPYVCTLCVDGLPFPFALLQTVAIHARDRFDNPITVGYEHHSIKLTVHDEFQCLLNAYTFEEEFLNTPDLECSNALSTALNNCGGGEQTDAVR
eukprot:1192597-Prorocentrum_minimum.AAC.9